MAKLTYTQLWTIVDAFRAAGLIAEGDALASRTSDWEVWEEEGRQEDERPTTGPRPSLRNAQRIASSYGFKLKRTPAGYTLSK